MGDAAYALAVDIGGTFTDIVLCDADGNTWVDKTLTTPTDLLEGFFRGVGLVLADANAKAEQVTGGVVHATTIVTNTLIERSGPPTALIVTAGFRDVLYIRDEHRYDMYDPQIEFPEPLIPSERTFEIKERVLGDGTITQTVDPDEVAAMVPEMRQKGVVSVAVCLLNAYRVPDNERAVGDALKAAAPDLHISLSSDVAPQMREYLRASTASVNAYTQPRTRPYLAALETRLAKEGYPHEPLIMLSHGGVVSAEMAGRFPVRMIESGPAAGAMVACHFAEKLGLDDLLSFDMGGTTAKACIIQERTPLVTGEFEVDRQYRFKPGSGFPVTVPSIDMIEIGAGGGSIAWVDTLGLLKVGPSSAGSEPGPACYGRGGDAVTVTDADLMLGLLDADNFLGGDMALDMAATKRALAGLAGKLGLDAHAAALGVFQVVGENMAAAARTHATDRGIDPRGLPVLAFGGAGPAHACHVAELLDSDKVIFPPLASVLSAFGTLVTPVRLDLVRSELGRLDMLDWDRVKELLEELETEAHAALLDAGIDHAQVRYGYGADMRYYGQANEATVSFESDPRALGGPENIRIAFEETYQRLYGVTLSDVPVEVVTWRLSAHGPEIERGGRVTLADVPGKPVSKRAIWFGPGSQPVDIFNRNHLSRGQVIDGPVIIEERETTIVVLPGWRAEVDDIGCVIAERMN